MSRVALVVDDDSAVARISGAENERVNDFERERFSS